MPNLHKLQFALRFLLGSWALYGALHSLAFALPHDKESSRAAFSVILDLTGTGLLARNAENFLFALFTLLFGLGWLCVGFSENLLLNNYKKTAIFVLGIPTLMLIFFFLGKVMFTTYPSFLDSMMSACGYAVISGFSFRYSAINVSSKLNEI
jgi:hypothetical protein